MSSQPPQFKSLLFKSSLLDQELNAWIDYDEYSHEIYPESYQFAAERLCGMIEEEPEFKEIGVFAIVYLYRHWLELRLKRVIVLASRLLGIAGKPPFGHELVPLWTEAKQLLQEFNTRQSPAVAVEPPEFRAIDNVIHDFSLIDSRGQAFRYPTFKGTKNLTGLKAINIRMFRDEMQTVSNLLDSACNDLDVACHECGL